MGTVAQRVADGFAVGGVFAEVDGVAGGADVFAVGGVRTSVPQGLKPRFF